MFLIVCLLAVFRVIFLVLRRLLIGTTLGLPLLLLRLLLLPHLIECLALLHDCELRLQGCLLLLLVTLAILILHTLLADRLRGLLLAVVLMRLLAIVVVLVVILFLGCCRLLLVLPAMVVVFIRLLLLMVLEVLLLAPFGAGVGVC